MSTSIRTLPEYQHAYTPTWRAPKVGIKEFGAVALSLLITALITLPVAALYMMRNPDSANDVVIIGTLIIQLVAIIASIISLQICGWKLQDIGFNGDKYLHPNLLWQIPAIIFLGFATVIIVMIVQYFNGADMEQFANDSQIVPEGITPSQVGILIVSLVVLAPIIEEILFRRILMGFMDNYMSSGLSTLLTSFIFAALHFNPITVIHAFVCGLGLSWLAREYKTLTAPILCHMVNNLLPAIAIAVTMI